MTPTAEPQRRPPPFLDAIVEDTRRALVARLQYDPTLTRRQLLRMNPSLMMETDGHLGLVAYRAQARLADLGIPVLPRLARWVCRLAGGFEIDDEVVIVPGVILPHGQVTIRGRTTIGLGCSVRPWTRLEPLPGQTQGPTLGVRVLVGTGAHVVGPVHVGDKAVIGAHAVVTSDVPAGATVVGNPARVVAEAPAVSPLAEAIKAKRRAEREAARSGGATQRRNRRKGAPRPPAKRSEDGKKR